MSGKDRDQNQKIPRILIAFVVAKVVLIIIVAYMVYKYV